MECFMDFINLIFPKVCPACGELLMKNESVICAGCLYALPRTNFHLERDNPVAKTFWGRVRLENATSFYSYQAGSYLRRLIHELKYKGFKEIGEELGRQFGNELQATAFNESELIIPVPLGKRKMKKRGFNQSECIARGLSLSMGKAVNTTAVIRTRNTRTQTKKSRYDRWLNVEDSFRVVDANALQEKHILLVDDVVTTGATIEACASEILKVPGAKVSVATLGVVLR
ncbi:MAG: ComF family protein [Bacteroidales bacterium]|nr:ComF family protein [Bacteroidales bacterium]